MSSLVKLMELLHKIYNFLCLIKSHNYINIEFAEKMVFGIIAQLYDKIGKDANSAKYFKAGSLLSDDFNEVLKIRNKQICHDPHNADDAQIHLTVKEKILIWLNHCKALYVLAILKDTAATVDLSNKLKLVKDNWPDAYYSPNELYLDESDSSLMILYFNYVEFTAYNNLLLYDKTIESFLRSKLSSNTAGLTLNSTPQLITLIYMLAGSAYDGGYNKYLDAIRCFEQAYKFAQTIDPNRMPKIRDSKIINCISKLSTTYQALIESTPRSDPAFLQYRENALKYHFQILKKEAVMPRVIVIHAYMNLFNMYTIVDNDRITAQKLLEYVIYKYFITLYREEDFRTILELLNLMANIYFLNLNYLGLESVISLIDRLQENEIKIKMIHGQTHLFNAINIKTNRLDYEITKTIVSAPYEYKLKKQKFEELYKQCLIISKQKEAVLSHKNKPFWSLANLMILADMDKEQIKSKVKYYYKCNKDDRDLNIACYYKIIYLSIARLKNEIHKFKLSNLIIVNKEFIEHEREAYKIVSFEIINRFSHIAYQSCLCDEFEQAKEAVIKSIYCIYLLRFIRHEYATLTSDAAITNWISKSIDWANLYKFAHDIFEGDILRNQSSDQQFEFMNTELPDFLNVPPTAEVIQKKLSDFYLAFQSFKLSTTKSDDLLISSLFPVDLAACYGRVVHKIKGDSNYQFRAIADQLQLLGIKEIDEDDDSKANNFLRDLQYLAVEHIRNNPKIYGDFTEVMSFNSYIVNMEKDRILLDKLTIPDLSQVFQISIIVIRNDSNKLIINRHRTDRLTPIVLGYETIEAKGWDYQFLQCSRDVPAERRHNLLLLLQERGVASSRETFWPVPVPSVADLSLPRRNDTLRSYALYSSIAEKCSSSSGCDSVSAAYEENVNRSRGRPSKFNGVDAVPQSSPPVYHSAGRYYAFLRGNFSPAPMPMVPPPPCCRPTIFSSLQPPLLPVVFSSAYLAPSACHSAGCYYGFPRGCFSPIPMPMALPLLRRPVIFPFLQPPLPRIVVSSAYLAPSAYYSARGVISTFYREGGMSMNCER